MKIAIVAPSPVPYTIGGAEYLFQEMHNAINNLTNHQCELIKLPVKEDSFWNLIDSYYSFFMLDLSHFDLVISTKYPSWMVQHRNHTVYLIHHLRGLFDTYHFCNEPLKVPESFRVGQIKEILRILETQNPARADVEELFGKLSELRKDRLNHDPLTFKFPGPFIREIIRYLDRFALAHERVKRYLTMSETVRRREDYFPREADVLIIPPPPPHKTFRSTGWKYLFTASRLDNPKRIGLMIKAMQHVHHAIPLKIAGAGPEEKQLKILAGDDRRIEFLGFVPDNKMEELYADSLAVLFTPYEEDYGFITLEAMMSRKPVISTIDSGGPIEFITDNQTGYIVDPDPEKIAAKINLLFQNKNDAIRMGQNAYNRVKMITWDKFVSELLEDPTIMPPPKKKILVLSTYSCYPPRGGGQHRLYNMYSRLAKEYDITICSIVESNKEYQNLVLLNGLKQICIPQSREHAKAQWELERQTGKNLFDITMIEHVEKTHEYIETIKKISRESDIIIFSHPYLFNVKKFIDPGKKVIYDSIDTEYLQKRNYIDDKKIQDLVFLIEKNACSESDIIWTTSMNEKKNLSELYGIPQDKVTVVPNGTDTQFLKYYTNEEKRQAKRSAGISGYQTVLFIGSWHPPNLEALRFITEKLAVNMKEIRFLIVGSIKDYYLQQKRTFPQNVLAFGSVDEYEKAELYNIADVALNPMFTGSGTNLKILDYMSAGIPVISTPLGARGIEIINNVDAIICETYQFPEKIRKILENEEIQELLRSNARKLVEEKYSWESITRKAAESLNKTENKP